MGFGEPLHDICVPGVAVSVRFTGNPAQVDALPEIEILVGVGFTEIVPMAFTEPQLPINGMI